VPVVSAVGHEIDFSIADFVADLRAPTPSAAAELLVPDAVAIGRHLQQLQQRQSRLDRLHTRLLAQHPRARLSQLTRRLEDQHLRLQRAIAQILERRRTTLRHAGHALHAISPLATLERGYAILFDTDGQVLRSVQGVTPGTKLRARLTDGELGLRVDQDALPPAFE
jgi:exodeoxyribonuclease VII large subunit